MKTAIPVLFLIFVFLFGCGESDVTIEDSNGDPDAFEENTDSEISDWTNPGDEESANGDFDADIAENPEIEENVENDTEWDVDNDTGDPEEIADEAEPQLCDFIGLVRDFAQPEFLRGMTVHLLDNETGAKLTQYGSKISVVDGSFEFNDIPCGLYGFLVEGNKEIENKTVDTYQFDIPADAQYIFIWSVDELLFVAAPPMGGITQEERKSLAMGRVYWMSEDDIGHPVGCAHVVTIPETDGIRYFSDDHLPTILEVQAGVNDYNGAYLACNLPAEETGKEIIFTAHYGGRTIGSARCMSFPDSVSIVDIYVDERYASNPSNESGNCLDK